MREAAGYLKGEHDFKSFCNIHTQVEDTVRTIYDLEVEKEEELITIRVRGNGFLYNMVRAMVGTIVYAAEGKLSPADIPAIVCSLIKYSKVEDVDGLLQEIEKAVRRRRG